MIVAEMKPLKEILESIKNSKKVLIAGCGGCVTVCLSGGQKEAEILSHTINLKRKLEREKWIVLNSR